MEPSTSNVLSSVNWLNLYSSDGSRIPLMQGFDIIVILRISAQSTNRDGDMSLDTPVSLLYQVQRNWLTNHVC